MFVYFDMETAGRKGFSISRTWIFEHLLVVLPFCHKCLSTLYTCISSSVVQQSLCFNRGGCCHTWFFCSGLSLFNFILEPSDKNPVGLQLSVCSGHIFLILFLSAFLHVKLQVLGWVFFGQWKTEAIRLILGCNKKKVISISVWSVKVKWNLNCQLFKCCDSFKESVLPYVLL